MHGGPSGQGYEVVDECGQAEEDDLWSALCDMGAGIVTARSRQRHSSPVCQHKLQVVRCALQSCESVRVASMYGHCPEVQVVAHLAHT
jgi:hypothetical protein